MLLLGSRDLGCHPNSSSFGEERLSLMGVIWYIHNALYGHSLASWALNYSLLHILTVGLIEWYGELKISIIPLCLHFCRKCSQAYWLPKSIRSVVGRLYFAKMLVK